MARLIAIHALAVTLVAGCSCAAPLGPDSGRAGADTSVDGGQDAYVDDTGSLPDVDLRAPLCGPIVATACPIQAASIVSACPSGEGAVYFDGGHCRQSPSLACGPERGAFTSFEECAVVCEAAGFCDASKFVLASPDTPSGCVAPPEPNPACPGGLSIVTFVPLPSDCAAFAPCTDCYGEASPVRCGPASFDSRRTYEDTWRVFRRASLLPFVVQLDCSLGGD